MSDTRRHYRASFEPVSPIDITDNAQRRSRNIELEDMDDEKKYPSTTTRSRNSSSSSSNGSLKTPRTARFAEATTVHSPVHTGKPGRSPFADPTQIGGKPSDIGFGYMADNDASVHASYPGMPVEHEVVVPSNGQLSPPLKSALKTPGTPGRMLNPLSPTFREEQLLEKEEGKTEVQNAKDLKIKFRVRAAKLLLRGVNFSCSLIVLSMMSSTFTIFNSTKALPSRSGLTAWAAGTNPWEQYTTLAVSCVSLFFSIVIFWAYFRRGRKRAEKVAVYYTVFAVFFFSFSIIMWGFSAGILHAAKANSNNKDLWGWSCVNNKRRQLFESDVKYALVCRLQNWSLVCCLIEVIVEVITIAIYAVVFYRFYSKRRLKKSMEVRDKARSDLYLAQLRTQSAPNTPGFATTPRSPYFPTSPGVHRNIDAYATADVKGFNTNTHYIDATMSPSNATKQPFQLQAPPIRVQAASPKPAQEGFESTHAQKEDRINDHVEAAPGEQKYDAVPIPGAYASPLSSPSFAPPQHGSLAGQMNSGSPGQAM